MSEKKLTEFEEHELRQNAVALRNNPVFMKAIQALEDKYVGQWITSGLLDQGQREVAYFMVRAIEELKTEIDSFAATGNINSEAVKEWVRSNS